ncbi:MAG TPA: NAD-dependent epimerase/dehydratase family protein [Ornithinibacter sp.]|nr:NAD-dependent epimerase/dehydratase family protein [Ornithinibacter sp.]
MTVLLSGGAGFVGQHLARRLTAVRFEVAALDLLHPQVHADPEAARRAFPGPVVVGDVADRRAWTTAAAQVRRVEALVHLAAETGTGQSMYEVDRYHRVNVDGTRRAAEFAVGHGIPLVVLSSWAVYGQGRYECRDHRPTFGRPCCPAAMPAPSREDDPHHPVSVLGETKSLAESVAIALCGDRVPVTVVRPQSVVGPGQSLHNPYAGVLAAFLAMLREQRPLRVHGDGSQTRDVVHVDDLAALLTHLVAAPPAPGAPLVLNGGTGVRTSLVELAALVTDAAPVPGAGLDLVGVRRAGDVEHACADLTRLTEFGAPIPARSAADAVRDFVRTSWERPGAPASRWDEAFAELEERGLTS